MSISNRSSRPASQLVYLSFTIPPGKSTSWSSTEIPGRLSISIQSPACWTDTSSSGIGTMWRPIKTLSGSLRPIFPALAYQLLHPLPHTAPSLHGVQPRAVYAIQGSLAEHRTTFTKLWMSTERIF